MLKRNQLVVFLIFLIVYALCAFLTYALFSEQLAAAAGVPMPDLGVSNVVLGLANAGIILVMYGLLGMAGIWFARKLGLPGVYREGGDWRHWVLIPMGLGALCGFVLIAGDLLFAPVNEFGRMPHPAFPVSLLASLSAGIGEEIAFRGFVFGLWAFFLSWILRRFNGRTAALWIANVLAALAFGAAHLGSMFVLAEVSSLADLNPYFLAEILLLNGVVGLVAGERYMKDGLVAAAGVHFWADMVWHVLWGLM
ncbi:MAG: CPBP family glutamic-type intramembrane protease [Anaerolineales bacterium]